MIIGIDASRAVKNQKTGTEYYSENIIFEISKLDYKNKYILYSPIKPKSGILCDLPSNFSWKIITQSKLWTQVHLSWEMAFGKKPDILFVPSHTIPFIHPKKTIVTIHDLAFKHFPGLFSNSELNYQNFGLNLAIKNAFHIIAVSEYTKSDLVKNCNINPNKITVIHHGYNQTLYKPLSKEDVQRDESTFQSRR